MLVSRVGAYLVGMGFIQSTPGAPAGKKMKLLLNVNGSIYPRLAAARLKKRESRSPTRGCGFLSFFR